MKKYLFLLLILCMPLLAACSKPIKNTNSHEQLLSVKDHSFVTMQVNDVPRKFEVVNSPQSTTQGLSGRSEIGSDGLLFIFPKTGFVRFWMKEMTFDLDLIWLHDLKVVDITPFVPQPTSPTESLPLYSSKNPMNEVLEVPAGTVQKWQLKIGDTFRYSW